MPFIFVNLKINNELNEVINTQWVENYKKKKQKGILEHVFIIAYNFVKKKNRL